MATDISTPKTMHRRIAVMPYPSSPLGPLQKHANAHPLPLDLSTPTLDSASCNRLRAAHLAHHLDDRRGQQPVPQPPAVECESSVQAVLNKGLVGPQDVEHERNLPLGLRGPAVPSGQGICLCSLISGEEPLLHVHDHNDVATPTVRSVVHFVVETHREFRPL